MLLHTAVKGGIQLCVGQLVLMVPILGTDLLQAIDSLVVVAGRRAAVAIEGHDAFGIRLHLMIFGLGGLQLHLIVRRLKACQQVALLHPCSLLCIEAVNSTADTEGQVDVLGRLHPVHTQFGI